MEANPNHLARQCFWNEQFLNLQAFLLLHGHCNVPASYVSVDSRLVLSMEAQRTEYYRKRSRLPSPLTAHQEAMLDAIGFPWQQVEIPPVSLKLASMPATERKQCRQKKSIPAKKKTQIVSKRVLGGESTYHSVIHDENWETSYQLLVEFQKEHGHCDVSQVEKKSSVLSRWVQRQRFGYMVRKKGKRSSMTDSRIERLDEIGFIWDKRDQVWQQRMNELREFRAKHGHDNVPKNYPENQALSSWVIRQHRLNKQLDGNEHCTLVEATLDDIEISRRASNRIKKPPNKGTTSVPQTDQEFTKLKSIKGIPICHLKVDTLRAFSSRCGVTGCWNLSKKSICDRLVAKKIERSER